MSKEIIQPNQRVFLTELHELFKKYHVDSVYYCRTGRNASKLCFPSNGQLLILDWSPHMTCKPDGAMGKANYEFWSVERGFRVIGHKKVVHFEKETVSFLPKEDLND